MVGLMVVMLLQGASPTPACPSAPELDARMANLLLEVRPQMTIGVLGELLGGPSHGSFYPKDDGTREAMYEPRVGEGSREVGAGMRCFFGADALLRSCQVDVGPFHTQYVERSQVDKLRAGLGIVDVFRVLCPPGRIEMLPSGGMQAWYFLKTGGLYGAQIVKIDFDSGGRLLKVGVGH